MFGAVDVQYEVRHSQWYPTEIKGAVTVPDKQNQVTRHLIHITVQLLNCAAILVKLSANNFNHDVLLIKGVLTLKSKDESELCVHGVQHGDDLGCDWSFLCKLM